MQIRFVLLALFGIALLFSDVCLAANPSNNPSWNMPYLLPDKKDGGVSAMQGVEYLRLFFATKAVGTYNMSPMLSFLNKMFLATFKNSPVNSDMPGQRVLYSQSLDGGESWTDPANSESNATSALTWLPSNEHAGIPIQEHSSPRVLFPNVSTASNPAALFAEPTVLINGHVYAAASPKQFCLYPDQYASVLLLRRVFDGQLDSFGPMFWASKEVPDGWEENSQVHQIPTLLDMDAETQADIAVLLTNSTYRPCDANPLMDGHTTKCEWCPEGCQNWTVVFENVPIIENERAHYLLLDGGDVILYRSKKEHVPNFLYASVRPSYTSPWPIPTVTNITDDVSNINAGNLQDGRAYLLSNALIDIARNPLYLSTTDQTNMRFVQTNAIANCFDPVFTSDRQPIGCLHRHAGSGKEGGCQYPQAVPINNGFFYAIFSLNKEDIWLLRFPISQA